MISSIKFSKFFYWNFFLIHKISGTRANCKIGVKFNINYLKLIENNSSSISHFWNLGSSSVGCFRIGFKDGAGARVGSHLEEGTRSRGVDA